MEKAAGQKRIRSINQAVAFLKEMDPDTAISYSAIVKAIKNNDIPCVLVGNRRLVTLESVMEYFGV